MCVCVCVCVCVTHQLLVVQITGSPLLHSSCSEIAQPCHKLMEGWCGNCTCMYIDMSSSPFPFSLSPFFFGRGGGGVVSVCMGGGGGMQGYCTVSKKA